MQHVLEGTVVVDPVVVGLQTVVESYLEELPGLGMEEVVALYLVDEVRLVPFLLVVVVEHQEQTSVVAVLVGQTAVVEQLVELAVALVVLQGQTSAAVVAEEAVVQTVVAGKVVQTVVDEEAVVQNAVVGKVVQIAVVGKIVQIAVGVVVG